LSAHCRFCSSKFQYQASVNFVPASASGPAEWMSVMNIRPTERPTPFCLSWNWLYCLTRFTSSPPACMVPSTSGLAAGACSSWDEKSPLVFGNSEVFLPTTLPPAASTALLKLFSMSCPNA
jgi:hypothetical protein